LGPHDENTKRRVEAHLRRPIAPQACARRDDADEIRIAPPETHVARSGRPRGQAPAHQPPPDRIAEGGGKKKKGGTTQKCIAISEPRAWGRGGSMA